MPIPASQLAATIAENPAFNSRCQLIALQFAVNAVLVESGGTTNHTNRIAFAARVVSGLVKAETLARVVLTDPSIQAAAVADASNAGAAVADSNIDGRIQATWDALANAPLV